MTAVAEGLGLLRRIAIGLDAKAEHLRDQANKATERLHQAKEVLETVQ